MCSWGLKLPVSPTDNAVGQLDVGAGLINTPETFHIISEFKRNLIIKMIFNKGFFSSPRASRNYNIYLKTKEK